jgi:hypothetical protein
MTEKNLNIAINKTKENINKITFDNTAIQELFYYSKQVRTYFNQIVAEKLDSDDLFLLCNMINVIDRMVSEIQGHLENKLLRRLEFETMQNKLISITEDFLVLNGEDSIEKKLYTDKFKIR